MVQTDHVMNKVIAIVGPTATGKSLLGIRLAKALDTEVISCDAMQLYIGMDIGTAKLTLAERDGVKHHLLDVLDPQVSFSVADYQKLVREKIANLHELGKTPILVGGSGLYLQAVLYDYLFVGDKRQQDDREAYAELSNDELASMLEKADSELARTIHPNNRRRLIRSLEIAGLGASESRNPGKNLYYQNTVIIALNLDRNALYSRIENRVDQMIGKGLVEEARKLFDSGIRSQSVMAIGYKELFPYFRGETSLEECIELIKQNSRRYAKRQLTWFRNKMLATWFDVDEIDFETTIRQVTDYIKKTSVDDC